MPIMGLFFNAGLNDLIAADDFVHAPSAATMSAVSELTTMRCACSAGQRNNRGKQGGLISLFFPCRTLSDGLLVFSGRLKTVESH